MKNLFLAVQLILYSFSSFAFSDDIPLSAYYDQVKKVVKLKWQPDQNMNQSFIIQRSKNNLQWEEIGKVTASRNIESFTDLKPDPAANHYRLKSSTAMAAWFSRLPSWLLLEMLLTVG